MSQEDCSQEKRFKPNDDLYANLFSNVMSNLPKQNKRRSSILKTVDGNLDAGEDRRASRRVSFANNLFMQEVRPDGTTQLTTEPFKSNRITAQQPPAGPQPVINPSINRTNAKRKFEETHGQDTLICDSDMELTRLDEKNNASKFSNAFSLKDMTLLKIVTSRENSVWQPNSSNCPVPNGFETVANNSDMELTNLSAIDNSDLTDNLNLTHNLSKLLATPANKSKFRSFVAKEKACSARSKSRQSVGNSENLLALNSSNINKENQTVIGPKDMSITLNRMDSIDNLTSATDLADELNNTTANLTTNPARVLNSKCTTKLTTKALKSSTPYRRYSTSNVWAINKDKIHSTTKNQSLLKQTDLTAFEELNTSQRPTFVNKTLRIQLPMDGQTSLVDQATVEPTETVDENDQNIAIESHKPTNADVVVAKDMRPEKDPTVCALDSFSASHSAMEITKTADDLDKQLPDNSQDIVPDEEASAMVNSDQTIDRMLNTIKVNIDNQLKEHSRLTATNRDLSTLIEVDSEASTNHLSQAVVTQQQPANNDKIFNETFDKVDAEPHNDTFDIGKSENPFQAPLQASFDVNQVHLQPHEANPMASSTDNLAPTQNNQSHSVQADPVQDAKNLIENAAEFLNEQKSSSLNDFKLSQSIGPNSQSSLPPGSTSNSSAKEAVDQFSSMKKPENSTFVQIQQSEEPNRSVCIAKQSNLAQEEEQMEVQTQETEVQETEVPERKNETSVQQNEKEVSVQHEQVSIQQPEQEVSLQADDMNPSRRPSLLKDLSSLDRELDQDLLNDTVLAFQTQTEFESIHSDVTNNDATSYEMECEDKKPASEATMNCQINELEKQRRLAELLIGEKSLYADFIENTKMQDDEKLKDYFLQQNKTAINLKAFNGQITLALELENPKETEYSTVRDMRLVFDFDKPVLKFWSDKFYLLYADRPEDKNFVEILKIILTTRFDQQKAGLLRQYTTTDYLANIQTEVELMLDRVADFAKDIRITCLKFIRNEFKIKKDHTFDFCVNLFGLSNKRFSVILNVNYAAEDFSVKPRFNCWYDEKRFYPFDAIKGIVEELNGKHELKINQIVTQVNGFVRKLKRSFLEQSVRTALKNWESTGARRN